jgi:hypothetical protein
MHWGHGSHEDLRGHSIGQFGTAVGLIRHSGERERRPYALDQNEEHFALPNGPLFLRHPDRRNLVGYFWR